MFEPLTDAEYRTLVRCAKVIRFAAISDVAVFVWLGLWNDAFLVASFGVVSAQAALYGLRRYLRPSPRSRALYGR